MIHTRQTDSRRDRYAGPGLDAMKAVLWPNNTNYYYFCANVETKEVYYAETNEQHEENLIKAGIDINDLDYDD
ncbi:endolytic transglycosylase MltG [Ruminococcus sp. HUN007]|uniref:endolytic transglycosylase MltG n=1 Tax=Ruminococcus sp. HUN007 TaxID=1514668 RepID=UPI0009DF6892|nr:endolytic transglycosylase MltG [Ruminococcus sp. HUN007]